MDEKGNKLSDSAKATKQEKFNLLGTLNRVAKFGAGGAADTDSTIRETAAGHLGFGVDSSATTPLLFNGDINGALGSGLPAFILQSNLDHARLEMRSASNSGHAPIVQGRAARGTLASPTASTLDLILGGFGGSGYDATNGFAVISHGFIGIKAGELWSSTSHGTYMGFETTANGSTTRTEKMRILGVGRVGIGTTSPTAMLHATGNALTGVHGVSTALNGYGVLGEADTGAGAQGVWGKSTSGNGVLGSTTSATGAGVRAEGNGIFGTALRIAIGGISVSGAGLGASTPVFIHRADAGNTMFHVTTIDHPHSNGDPNAILIVTSNNNPGGGVGVVNNHAIGVFYNGAAAKWTIYNQDAAAITVNAAFNVLIVKP